MKELISKIFSLSARDRNSLLCKLAVKENLNNIDPIEQMQLELIQFIRKQNGEIDKVLKAWKDNPEIDPRITAPNK